MGVRIRRAAANDIEACGRIVYRAFKDIAERHNFPPDFPSAESAIRAGNLMIHHPAIFGLVAENNGHIVGTNFLDERDAIRAVGPIAVDPDVQLKGIGRRLMEAVLERSRGAPGVRLVQDAFNATSMSLYASLGFGVKEPLVLMTGKPRTTPSARIEVRRLVREDLEACAALCRRVHGFERVGELRDALSVASPLVALREGRLAAYATTLANWGAAHGVADGEEELEALVLAAGATSQYPLSFLVPTRQARLFRFCLSQGLRVVKPMTLMAMGEYREPQGNWFPSVHY